MDMTCSTRFQDLQAQINRFTEDSYWLLSCAQCAQIERIFFLWQCRPCRRVKWSQRKKRPFASPSCTDQAAYISGRSPA